MRADRLAPLFPETPPYRFAVDRVDLDALDRFLRSERSPPDSMMLSELDGFLTGVAIGPDLVRPSEWLEHVWGGETPAFASHDEATAVLGLLMARYNEILCEIADDTLSPIFWSDRNDAIIATDWAEGFVQAITLRADAWQRLFTSSRARMFLIPILLLCRDADGRALFGLLPAENDSLDEQATEFLPDCVMEIAAYWRRTRPKPLATSLAPTFGGEPHRAHAKIGRNEPCPCGSGKKFKRCCGRGG